MLWNAGRRDVAIKGLCEAADELVALAGTQSSGWAGSENEVAVQVNHESIGGSGKQRSALSGHTKNVGTRLLNEVLSMSGVNNRNVQAAPFVYTNAKSDSLGSHSKHGRVMRDEYDSAGG